MWIWVSLRIPWIRRRNIIGLNQASQTWISFIKPQGFLCSSAWELQLLVQACDVLWASLRCAVKTSLLWCVFCKRARTLRVPSPGERLAGPAASGWRRIDTRKGICLQVIIHDNVFNDRIFTGQGENHKTLQADGQALHQLEWHGRGLMPTHHQLCQSVYKFDFYKKKNSW